LNRELSRVVAAKQVRKLLLASFNKVIHILALFSRDFNSFVCFELDQVLSFVIRKIIFPLRHSFFFSRLQIKKGTMEQPPTYDQSVILVDGWERRQTMNGRFYYLHHETKRSSWTPGNQAAAPAPAPPAPVAAPSLPPRNSNLPQPPPTSSRPVLFDRAFQPTPYFISLVDDIFDSLDPQRTGFWTQSTMLEYTRLAQHPDLAALKIVTPQIWMECFRAFSIPYEIRGNQFVFGRFGFQQLVLSDCQRSPTQGYALLATYLGSSPRLARGPYMLTSDMFPRDPLPHVLEIDRQLARKLERDVAKAQHAVRMSTRAMAQSHDIGASAFGGGVCQRCRNSWCTCNDAF
jgi:hypothetical protein